MQNLQETEVIGSAWIRARRTVIENELDKNPQINFVMERVVRIAEDDTLKQDYGNIQKTLTEENGNTVFDVLNPNTGEVVSQMTYNGVAAILYSLFVHEYIEATTPVPEIPTEDRSDLPTNPTDEPPINAEP